MIYLLGPTTAPDPPRAGTCGSPYGLPPPPILPCTVVDRSASSCLPPPPTLCASLTQPTLTALTGHVFRNMDMRSNRLNFSCTFSNGSDMVGLFFSSCVGRNHIVLPINVVDSLCCSVCSWGSFISKIETWPRCCIHVTSSSVVRP